MRCHVAALRLNSTPVIACYHPFILYPSASDQICRGFELLYIPVVDQQSSELTTRDSRQKQLTTPVSILDSTVSVDSSGLSIVLEVSAAILRAIHKVRHARGGGGPRRC